MPIEVEKLIQLFDILIGRCFFRALFFFDSHLFIGVLYADIE